MADPIENQAHAPPSPSVETVEYGRRVVQAMHDKYARFEQQAREKGDEAQADSWRRITWALTRDLLGYEDGGCVITAFDRRWLDPEWRAWYEGVGA